MHPHQPEFLLAMEIAAQNDIKTVVLTCANSLLFAVGLRTHSLFQ